MSSDAKIEITKGTIDRLLKETAKEYRKLAGTKVKAELILIGGAAVMINYDFRGVTNDVDAIIEASSAMKDAVNIIRDRYDLPNGWLNDDFKKTDSFSPKLSQYSRYYRTYSNVLQIRTITGPYLIAMKLRSARSYKNDLSDILGILAEHDEKDDPISLEDIQSAYTNLYGDWSDLSKDSRDFISGVINSGNYEAQYTQLRQDETETRSILVQFDKNHPHQLNSSNLKEIVEKYHSKKG